MTMVLVNYETLLPLIWFNFNVTAKKFFQIQWNKTFSPVHSFASSWNSPTCLLFQLLYVCHMFKKNHLEEKWERRSSSCSQCSLWDFFTPILLIPLSWYLLRATLFYWDFMGEKCFILMKWEHGMFLNKQWIFTKGVVMKKKEGWVLVVQVALKGTKWACGWRCCLPLASSGKECQPTVRTGYHIPPSLLLLLRLLLSQRGSSLLFYFLHQYPREMDCPFAHPVIVNNTVSHLTSISLGQKNTCHRRLLSCFDLLQLVSWTNNKSENTKALQQVQRILKHPFVPFDSSSKKAGVSLFGLISVYTTILCVLCCVPYCASKWEING